MTNFKYLQKLFFLLVMGFSLSFICACGDDEEDEPVQNPNEEETVKPDDEADKGDENEQLPSDDEKEPPVAKFKHYCPDENHPHAIDMGSGVKWACCNVGANHPHEVGGLYAWGETEEKEEYTYSNYKYFEGNYRIEQSNSSFMKYERYDVTDIGENIAGTQYDVAHVKWGDGYQIPDEDDFYELLRINKDTYEWTTLNGTEGMLITSKKTQNRLFIPLQHGYSDRIGFWTCERYKAITNCYAKEFIYFKKSPWYMQSFTYDQSFYKGRPIRPIFVK